MRIRPGSDHALALGIGRVMVSEELYDAEFVECWCYGFEQYADLVGEWTPERTAEVCWCEPEDVVAAARMIAGCGPALLQWGVALDQREDCMDGARAVLDLFAITGNLEKPGSNIIGPELLKYITGWGRDFLPFEREEKRIGANELMVYKLGLQVAHMGMLVDHMIELWSQGLEFMGLDPLPHYEEPPMTPLSQPELYEEYPLVPTTGARRHNTFHSENRQGTHLRPIHPEPTIMMHPDAAARFGVSAGQWVWVEGPIGDTGRVGRAKRVVELSAAMDARVASTDHGWWRPEGDPERLFDVNDLNINNLIPWTAGKMGVGANYKCILCRVRPVKVGE